MQFQQHIAHKASLPAQHNSISTEEGRSEIIVYLNSNKEEIQQEGPYLNIIRPQNGDICAIRMH